MLIVLEAETMVGSHYLLGQMLQDCPDDICLEVFASWGSSCFKIGPYDDDDPASRLVQPYFTFDGPNPDYFPLFGIQVGDDRKLRLSPLRDFAESPIGIATNMFSCY